MLLSKRSGASCQPQVGVADWPRLPHQISHTHSLPPGPPNVSDGVEASLATTEKQGVNNRPRCGMGTEYRSNSGPIPAYDYRFQVPKR